MTVTGATFSAGIGAAEGYGGYRITYKSHQKFLSKAKETIGGMGEDAFVKSHMNKVKALYAEKNATFSEEAKVVETNIAKSEYRKFKEALSKAKATKMKFLAGAAALGLGVYAVVKKITNKGE